MDGWFVMSIDGNGSTSSHLCISHLILVFLNYDGFFPREGWDL